MTVRILRKLFKGPQEAVQADPAAEATTVPDAPETPATPQMPEAYRVPDGWEKLRKPAMIEVALRISGNVLKSKAAAVAVIKKYLNG